jgi:hypothetical protein
MKSLALNAALVLAVGALYTFIIDAPDTCNWRDEWVRPWCEAIGFR